jgi:3-deoxy-D-manno-octulosonic-acid transferase
MVANLIYMIALCLVSPLVAYRVIRHGRYRRGVGQKLFGISRSKAKILRGDGECIWIHAVSVGEVNLLGGMIDRLKQVSPGTAVAISTSTDTGFDLACDKLGADHVFFCPLDFTWAVRRTLKRLQPTQLVLAELELWPNLVRAAERRSVPVRVVNGRLSERSASRYIKFSALTKTTFQRLSWVGCQDDLCRDRFARCGVPIDRLQVTGSIKFDDAPSSRETTEVHQRAQWAGADPWHRTWIAGSTGPGEESMVVDIYNHLRGEFPELRLILVPRHRERFDEVASLVRSAGLVAHRRSTDGSMFDDGWESDRVIIVDTIGELRHWWGVGQIATVGGSFGDRGGQNMLEPAGYGNAVSFGPNTRNFKQIAQQLIENGGAVRTASASELAQFVRRCLTDIPAADSLGRAAREVIARHRGATARTVDALATSKLPTQTRHAA